MLVTGSNELNTTKINTLSPFFVELCLSLLTIITWKYHRKWKKLFTLWSWMTICMHWAYCEYIKELYMKRQHIQSSLHEDKAPVHSNWVSRQAHIECQFSSLPSDNATCSYAWIQWRPLQLTAIHLLLIESTGTIKLQKIGGYNSLPVRHQRATGISSKNWPKKLLQVKK